MTEEIPSAETQAAAEVLRMQASDTDGPLHADHTHRAVPSAALRRPPILSRLGALAAGPDAGHLRPVRSASGRPPEPPARVTTLPVARAGSPILCHEMGAGVILCHSIGMPRPPDGAEPRTEMLRTRVTPAGAAEVDKWRGAQSRAAFLREAVSAYCGQLAAQQRAMIQITAHHKPGSR